MNHGLPLVVALAAAVLAGPRTGAAAEYRPPRKSLGFPIYTNAPAGRQLTGQHAPASTPALSPEEAQRRFTAPDGFEVRLFASEPEVVNPVAMTWDTRGRLWVVELYEYPMGAKPGSKPRDRIKILEDTDADGRADKVHVWADGLNLATGILLGDGGAYVGQAPHLLFLKDTDGDDRADQSSIVQTGFGLEDRHELLNGFTWGPDGYLYMTHGVFTRSAVVDPGNPGQEPVLLTAGVARLHLREPRRFEVFAEGTSNPWGVDFDRFGNAFVSACVIEHLFHMAPAGIYDRQAGNEPHPFAYGRLPAINDHKHHMAAYAGVQVYEGNQFPADNLGTILQGNIHDNAVHQDRLKASGATFVASAWRDLVRANDGWFMPVSVQVGPDGAVWIMDWYDRYPCYQNANADPEGVDREHGRIWRVVHTGGRRDLPVPSRPSPDFDLSKLSSAELVDHLEHPNAWHRRTAQRLLTERRDDKVMGLLQQLFAHGPTRGTAQPLDARLAAFWTLHTSGYLADDVLRRAATDDAAPIRAWAARFIGERQVGQADLPLLEALAGDPDPTVRLAVAVACRQFVSSQLTVNRPVPGEAVQTAPVLARLVMASGATATPDPVVSFVTWMGLEPLVLAERGPILRWLAEHGPQLMPLSGDLAGRVLRRLADSGRVTDMDPAVRFIRATLPSSPALAHAALLGWIRGQEGRALPPPPDGPELLGSLQSSQHRGLAEAGFKLGALWGDAASIQSLTRSAADASADEAERVRALQALRSVRNTDLSGSLLPLLAGGVPERVQLEALNILGQEGRDATGGEILARWKTLPIGTRSAAAGTLVSRKPWALALLAQMRRGDISASELGAPAVRALVQHRDEDVRREAVQAIGRFRDSSRDKAQLVAEKRGVVLGGEPNLANGHELARKSCLVCHKLHGEGAEVGPDLTGVGRSSVDALLWNIIDPNQIIGAGYEQVEVETRDDRVIAGRLMESNDARVRILMQGPREEVIARTDIQSLRTLESSVMPEGLEQIPDAEFRDLVWYILAPPQDGPLTPAKRQALSGGRPPH